MDSERFSHSAFRPIHTVSEVSFSRFVYDHQDGRTRSCHWKRVEVDCSVHLLFFSFFPPNWLIYAARVDPRILSLKFNVSTRSEPTLRLYKRAT